MKFLVVDDEKDVDLAFAHVDAVFGQQHGAAVVEPRQHAHQATGKGLRIGGGVLHVGRHLLRYAERGNSGLFK